MFLFLIVCIVSSSGALAEQVCYARQRLNARSEMIRKVDCSDPEADSSLTFDNEREVSVSDLLAQLNHRKPSVSSPVPEASTDHVAKATTDEVPTARLNHWKPSVSSSPVPAASTDHVARATTDEVSTGEYEMYHTIHYEIIRIDRPLIESKQWGVVDILFLEDGKECVVIGQFSKWVGVDSGVPQGATTEITTGDPIKDLTTGTDRANTTEGITRLFTSNGSFCSISYKRNRVNEVHSEVSCRAESGVCHDLGDANQSYPADCSVILEGGQNRSGVYRIQPHMDSFYAYCDMDTDGGGWTVFQRRMDGSVDFYRNWTDYREGFGDVGSEHWIGNEQLFQLTAQGSHELRVDLEKFDGDGAFAAYGNFSIGNKGSFYRLTIGGYSYDSDAGDSLATAKHQNQPFSTEDADHDTADHNCATKYTSGWWFGNCLRCNLNGLYRKGGNTTYAVGIVWRHWTGLNYSLKGAEMEVRRGGAAKGG